MASFQSSGGRRRCLQGGAGQFASHTVHLRKLQGKWDFTRAIITSGAYIGHIEHYLQTPKDNNSLQRCHRSIPIRPRVLIRSSTGAHARRLLNRAAHGGLDDTRVSLCKVTPVEHPPASPLGLLWWHGMGGGNWYPRSGVPRAGAAVCSLHAGAGAGYGCGVRNGQMRTFR